METHLDRLEERLKSLKGALRLRLPHELELRRQLEAECAAAERRGSDAARVSKRTPVPNAA